MSRLHKEISKLEQLATANQEKTEVWSSYNQKRSKTKIQVACVSRFRFSLILTSYENTKRY
jgi:hypothetical protein